MNIVAALKQEETKLQKQLTAIQGAIAAMNGGAKTSGSPMPSSSRNGNGAQRTISAALRAKLSRKAKERWARVKAEQSKGKKS